MSLTCLMENHRSAISSSRRHATAFNVTPSEPLDTVPVPFQFKDLRRLRRPVLFSGPATAAFPLCAAVVAPPLESPGVRTILRRLDLFSAAPPTFGTPSAVLVPPPLNSADLLMTLRRLDFLSGVPAPPACSKTTAVWASTDFTGLAYGGYSSMGVSTNWHDAMLWCCMLDQADYH